MKGAGDESAERTRRFSASAIATNPEHRSGRENYYACRRPIAFWLLFFFVV